jgi:hypothetical protein
MNQGTQGYSLTKKTEGRKSRDTVSLIHILYSNIICIMMRSILLLYALDKGTGNISAFIAYTIDQPNPFTSPQLNIIITKEYRVDIFRVQTRRVPLTIVFRYREIGGRLCTKC